MKNKMHRKIISMILVTCFFLTCMPAQALAESIQEQVQKQNNKYASFESVNNASESKDVALSRVFEELKFKSSRSEYNAEPQYSYELLKKYAHYSEMSAQDAGILRQELRVNHAAMVELESLGLNMEDSTIYAKLEYEHGFPVAEIVSNYQTQEECGRLSSELRKYSYYVKNNEDFDSSKAFRQYIFDGNSFQQVKRAYVLNAQSGTDIEELLAEEYDVSSTLSLPLEIEDIYSEEQKTSVQNGASRAGSPLQLPNINLNEQESKLLNQITAPTGRNDGDNVNLSTGEVTYEAVDAVIPGRNGLDLVIGHRYSSSDANLFNPGIKWSRSVVNGGSNMYYVVWQKWAVGSWGLFSTNPYGDMNHGYYAKTFNANEYSAYVTFVNKLIDDEYYQRIETFTNVNGSGQNLGLLTEVMDFGTFNLTPQYYNGSTQYIYRLYETYNQENSYYNDLYALGTGWGFMFSSIETIDKTQVLHLGDSRDFQIDITPAAGDSNLKNYTLTDLRLEKENGGYSGAVYTLYYKDGKKEHFDSQGRLIAIRDRYNNTITFAYSTQNNLPKITITDTLSRVTTISGASAGSGKHVMTVALPDGKTLKYTVNKVSNYFYGAQKSYALEKFEDQLNIATSYNYDILKSKYSYMSKNYQFLPLLHGFDNYTENDIICQSAEVDFYGQNTHGANDTHVLYLKTINHPTGYKTEYAYDATWDYGRIHNMGEGGARTTYQPEERAEKINNVAKHSSFYVWDYMNDYSGYPWHDDPENLPSGYTYQNVKSINDPESSYSDKAVALEFLVFNHKQLPIKRWDTNVRPNPTVHTIMEYEYNADRLPVKASTKTYTPFDFYGAYDPSTGQGAEPLHRECIEAYQYDNKGNVTASWSPLANGNTANTEYKTTYTYDSSYSLPLTKTYKMNASTTVTERNTVSGAGITRQEVLVNNVVKNKTEFEYDSYGNIKKSKKYKDDLTSFIETSYDYQSNAYLSEIKSAGVTNSDGSAASGTPGQTAGTIISKYQYDNMGSLTKATDANNLSTSFAYNDVLDMTKQTNHDNTTIEWDRNYTQNTLTVKDENGAQILYKYNPFGLEAETRDVLANALLTSKTYDALFRLKTETDAINGATNTYNYDGFSRLESKTTKNSAGTVLAEDLYAYNDVYNNGALLRVQNTIVGETNAPNIVSAQYINDMGQLEREGRVLNGAEHMDYNNYDYVGNKTQELLAIDAAKGLPYSAKLEYDFAGRVTKAYNTDGDYLTNTYNALEQLASSTDYAGTNTAYTYDAISRLLEEKGVVERIGPTEHYSIKRYDYDPAGNIIRARISNNPVGSAVSWSRTEYDYNNRNRLEYVTQYDGSAIDNVTKYTYDGAGNVLAIRAGMSGKSAPDGSQTSYTYDRLGRVLTMKDPLNQQETYTYKNNGLGLLNFKTDRNGNVSSHSYDALGRILTLQVVTPDNLTESNTYSYYKTGAKKAEANPAVSTVFVYDALGRLTKETESGEVSAVKQYTYDLANNRLTFNAAVGGTTAHNTAYTYDNQKRLQTVKDNGSLVATYGYNINGSRDSLTYSNGTSEHYTYNLANWITRVENRSGNTVVSAYDYTYYADGNQLNKTDNNDLVSTYTYDGAGRLKVENENTGFNAAYQYDRFGNRLNMTVAGQDNYTVAYDYDANNRLKQEVKTIGDVVTTGKYYYDPNGNQLSKVSETLSPANSNTPQVGFNASGVELYKYDGANRMTSSFVDGVEAAYTYRADGLRSKKITAEGETAHLWDGANIAADLAGNTIAARYVRGINLLCSDTGSGRQFYLYNGHGDVVQLTNAGGNVTKTYAYDALGNEKNPDPNDTNPFRYAGYYWDAETGTYYLQNRAYRPSTGSFTQEDPVRDGLNWYTYCGGNPIRYIDPSGLAREDTAYTYKTYKTVTETGLGARGTGVRTTTVVDKTYNMTQVRFTELNMTVYTLDGVNFARSPAALVGGNFVGLNDTTNLLGFGKDFSANTLGRVERMDMLQGQQKTFSIINFAVSAAEDIAFTATGIPYLIGVVVDGGVMIVDVTTNTIVGNAPSLGKVGKDLAGVVIPFAGTGIAFVEMGSSFNYRPSYSPYTPPKPSTPVDSSIYGAPSVRNNK